MNSIAILAALGAGLMGLIRIFRTDAVQSMLPQEYRWERWSALAQGGFVFGLSFAGALATALSQGIPIAAALSAAVLVALQAMGFNSATKNIGYGQTLAAVSKDTTYQPSALRDAISIALPINTELLQKIALSRNGNGVAEKEGPRG